MFRFLLVMAKKKKSENNISADLKNYNENVDWQIE